MKRKGLPQGLPTPLNISTIMVIHLALPSTMCNLALPGSGLNVVEIYSIRFSTKIEPQFLTKHTNTHNRQAYGDLE